MTKMVTAMTKAATPSRRENEDNNDTEKREKDDYKHKREDGDQRLCQQQQHG